MTDTAPSPMAAAPRGAPVFRLPRGLGAGGVYLVVAVLLVAGRALSADFWSASSLVKVVQDVSILGIVAVGLSFVTYGGHFVDLAIPVQMAVSGIVAVALLPWGIVAAALGGMASGALLGLVNGLVVGFLRLNPIIWTLAMMSVLSGVIRWAYAGRQIYPDEATAAGRAFLDLYHHAVFGVVPLPVVVLIIAAVAGHVVMRHTGYGAALKLTGSNYEVARLSGAGVKRVVASAFVISSLTSGVAGILLTSFNKVGAVYIGDGYDFKTVTAVVLGGMTLAGGRGNVAGVMGGVMAIALMNNVMSLVRIGEITIGQFQQNIVQGAVFILVVGINSFSRRKAGSDDA